MFVLPRFGGETLSDVDTLYILHFYQKTSSALPIPIPIPINFINLTRVTQLQKIFEFFLVAPKRNPEPSHVSVFPNNAIKMK